MAPESNAILAPDIRAVTCAILVAVGSRPGGERTPVPTLYPERVLLKLRAGTCANINAVLKPGLTRAEFIRVAIDEKIAQLRREAGIGVGTRGRNGGDRG